jgi:5-methylthioadenosine/S-adenosylhomocysteine deaminase
MPDRWVIRRVTTLDGGPPVDVVIKGTRIEAIGPDAASRYEGCDEPIDGRRLLIAPGYVNAHLHSHDRFDRGRFDALPLEVWMSAYNPPTVARGWSAEQTYLRTMLSGLDLIRSGTTTVVDDVHLGTDPDRDVVDAVFRAYSDLGIRAVVGVAGCDLPFYRSIPYLEQELPERLKRAAGAAAADDALGLWRDLAGSHCARVRVALSTSGPQRCTPEFLRRAQALSAELDLQVITHVLETRTQALTAERFFGRTMVDHMAAVEVLDHHSVLIHCVWITPDDIETIAGAGATVVHCPASNLKLGSGIAPVDRLRGAGVTVALGTDNHCANDSASMFEVTKLAASLHRAQPDFVRWPTATDAHAMATTGGARAAGLGADVGRLAVGMKADFMLLDRDAPALFPTHDATRQLVFVETGSSLRGVVVDGRIVMDGGVVTTISETDLLAELAQHEPAIHALIDAGQAAADELSPHVIRAYERCAEAWR